MQNSFCRSMQWDHISVAGNPDSKQRPVNKDILLLLLWGLQPFQGNLSPLWNRLVVENCAASADVWVWELDHVYWWIELLEPFQGEMAKWVHKLPKYYSNTAAVTALNWPLMRARLLVRKLSFLKSSWDSGRHSGWWSSGNVLMMGWTLFAYQENAGIWIGLGELCWHNLSIIVVWKHRSIC